MQNKFESYFAKKGEFKSIELTLDRISSALDFIDFDEKRLGKIIHIAGTNGKGSTAYFLHQSFIKANFNCVLYTSPHLESITERIVINNSPVEINTFNDAFDATKQAIEKFKLSYFEAITLIAFYIFQDLSPDISIIETGLGGTYDATNVLVDKIPVITTISQDHINFLGKSIYQIIDEKLNIIKSNQKVYIGKNENFIVNYIKNKLIGKSIFFSQCNKYLKSFPPPFNHNYELARLILKNEFQIDIPPADLLKLPPCRLEKIKNFLFDGAHNPSGIINLINNIDNIDTAIISGTLDRDIIKTIEIIRKKIKKVIITEIPNNERSIKVKEINIPGIYKISDPTLAVYKALELNGKSDILICGSLYLCGHLKKVIRDKFV
ncbi:MAG: FolC bifunctional protein [Deferribacteraceae bacterium]|jgi:dihydrofolate synthase/folylpolyglutamate synthase|nr:FolC bifunctional protein [Deferribacteraceae bacterium]